MTMTLKALGIAAGATLGLFVGYCIYFDHQRRKDPLYKKKVRDRRKEKAAAAKSAKSGKTKIPDLKDHEAIQMFFLQEVQLGEELLGAGDEEGAVEHLSNAVAVCGQPNQLLQVLQHSLPPHVFQLLLLKLPTVGQRMMGPTPPTATVIEDGVD